MHKIKSVHLTFHIATKHKKISFQKTTATQNTNVRALEVTKSWFKDQNMFTIFKNQMVHQQ